RGRIGGIEEAVAPALLAKRALPVEYPQVRRVERVFPEVEPVEFPVPDGFELTRLGPIEQRRIAGQGRWVVAIGAQVSEQHPAQLAQGIGQVAHPLVERAALRLSWLFQALAMHVEQPTVIDAADTLGLDVSIGERRPAMRTV